MTTQMSIAEAVRLGLLDASAKKPPKKKPGRAGAESRCVTCKEVFTSDAAETRHVEEIKHYRYETVLEGV